jgi:hypothetical protein
MVGGPVVLEVGSILVVVFTDRAFRLVVLSDGDDDLVGGAVGPERLEAGGVVVDGETVGDQTEET